MNIEGEANDKRILVLQGIGKTQWNTHKGKKNYSNIKSGG